MRNLLLLLVFSATLAACTPVEREYCAHQGVAPVNPEYPNCVKYFYDMDNWFERDKLPCMAKAKEVYPDYLYDRGHYGDVDYIGGVDRRDPIYGTRIVHIPADAWKNRQIDDLRLKLITPCMQAKGWNSGEDWQFGRKDGKTKPPKPSLPKFLQKK